MTSAHWGAELDDGRAAAFVGRREENAVFERFIEEKRPRVLHVYGAGGIGKTTLLRAWQRNAKQRDYVTAWVDGHALEPSPESFYAALDASPAALHFVFLDALEHLAAMESWLREGFLPSLPSHVRVVTAGRYRLGEPWQIDAGWRALVQEMHLAELSTEESRAYLEACGLASDAVERAHAVAHNHPLALSVAAELLRTRDDVVLHPRALDEPFVTALLERLVGEIPDARYRVALQAASLVRICNEPVLQAMTQEADDGVSELLRWIRRRPYTETVADGTRLHELARGVIAVDFRSRDPDLRQTFLERATRYYVDALTRQRGSRAEQLITDLYFALRAEPGASEVRLGEGADLYFDRPRSDDEYEEILDAVGRFEGARNADIARQWQRRQPGGVEVFRRSDERIEGFVHFIDLTSDTDEQEIASDPVLLAMWGYLCRWAPLRAAERARVARFWMGMHTHQDLAPIQTRLFVRLTHRMMLDPSVAVGVAVHVDPEQWMARRDNIHHQFASVDIAGRRFGLLGHDLRVHPRHHVLEQQVRIALYGPEYVGPPQVARIEVFDRDTFARAVRDALRSYHRPDRLAANPLVRSRIVAVRGAKSDDVAKTLRQVVEEACRSMEEVEADARAARILRTTFFDPEAKQLAAAAELGMAFSTYRRYLSRAIERITDILWDLEVGG